MATLAVFGSVREVKGPIDFLLFPSIRAGEKM